MKFDDIFESSGNQTSQPFDKEAWAAKKQEARQTLYDLADATAVEITGDGGKFQEYLDVQANFSRYSVTNALLLLAQMPRATEVKSFDDWKNAGATIKRGAKSISILEPGEEYTREDGTIGTSFNVKKVFDISQTSAKPRPAVSVDDRLLLKALIHRAPAAIEMVEALPGDAGAVYDHGKKTIFVCRGMDAPDLFRCVSQALAHAEISMSRREYDPAEAAFPAYCASYILCKQNGIDASGYDFSVLPDSLQGKDPQEVRAALTEIRDTAQSISARMSRVLESREKAPKVRDQER